MRYFQKCIRRAKVDIAYSKGFSPHQIMSFALALGVGVETDGDYLDIEVNSMDSTQAVMDSLNETMADGVRVENVVALKDDTPNAMSSVSAAGYRLIAKEGVYASDMVKACDIVLGKDEIIVAKENKKAKKKGKAVEGVNDIIYTDIKDHIYECSMTENELYCLVDASSAGNVRPLLLLDAIYSEAGETLDPLDIQVIRTDTYTGVYGDDRGLVPLDMV